MAPRRSVKICGKKGVHAVPGKLIRKRQTKITPLKVPSTITIKIPSQLTSLDVPDSMRKLDGQTKMALADEVARSQLLKPNIEVKPDPPATQKRSRKKWIESQVLDSIDVTTGKTDEITVRNNTVTKKVVTRKKVADSTVQKPVIKRKRVIKAAEMPNEIANSNISVQKPDTTAKETHKNNHNENSDLLHASTETKKRKNLSLKNKQYKTQTRQPSPILQTRSLKIPRLSNACKRPETPPIEQNLHVKTIVKKQHNCLKDTDALKINNAVSVESRKTSVSSISNLSWTRDISSSSTPTSITVSSNDFVRFDKKLPVIKLTNIDHEVNRYKASPTLDIDTSSDDHSESTETKTSYYRPFSNVGSVLDKTPSKINTINLSSSSCTSSTHGDEDTEYKKRDYGEVSENLMKILKKIDMEFINWLHVTDYVSSDLSKIKKKLFNILKSEFSALTYCHKLQELPNRDETSHTNKTKVEIEKQCVSSNTVKYNIVNNNTNFDRHIETTTNINRLDICHKVQENSKASGVTCKSYKICNSSNKYENTQCNIVNNSKTKSNKLSTDHSMLIKTYENNTVEHNKGLSNKFKYNTLENIKGKTIDNIRVEINKTGTKTVTYNPNETNNIDYKQITDEPVKTKQNKGSLIQDSAQSKLEEEIIKPSTTGVVSNISNSARNSQYSSNTSDSDCSSDNKGFMNENQTEQSYHDDDDALSLFAESLTGIESSRINTSVISAPTHKDIEEYIPIPIRNKVVSPNYTYCPTKISDNIKTVCEKQNADSTSIYKEKDTSSVTPEQVIVTQETKENSQMETEIEPLSISLHQPRLIENFIQTKPGDFNIIFKGYCLLNLMYRCPLANCGHLCRYSHDVPSDQEIKVKLSRLDKEAFTKEYLLVRRRYIMLRRFGTYFLYECAGRNYTRMLVEMAYDFFTKLKSFNDIMSDTVKVTAGETTLLHLNHVDLSVCEDLLTLCVNEDTLLCDIFMQIMTCTQNFSQFKPVFLNLTYFLVNNDRSFSLMVTEHILERVCILPYDEPVVRALIQIMRLTNPMIFQNSMIEKFENLISGNRDVTEEYWSLKKEVNFEELAKRMEFDPSSMQMVDQNPVTQSLDQHGLFPIVDKPLIQPVPLMSIKTMEPPQMNRPEHVPLPPSPDTTHLDNRNKFTEDTTMAKITRTIWGLNPGANPYKTDASPNSRNREEVIQMPRHNNWRHRSIFQQINRASFSPLRQPMRPPVRLVRPPHQGHMEKMPFARHRIVTVGGSPGMFPPPGPNFYDK